MDTAFSLVDNLMRVDYDHLPRQAIDTTKLDILDVLGTAMAGSTAEGAESVADLIKDWGGKKESTVIGFDCMVPSANAAWVNGMLSHALDYDDGHDGAVLHAAASVVPAAFAVAQRKGAVSGKDFIAAVALGIDLMCRMGLASKTNLRDSGWVYTSIFGYFGSAAAAGKVLKLSSHQMVNALGISLSQAAGSFQSIADAALTKRMQPGFASKGGVLAALLAERGITGPTNCIDGEWGIYKLYLRGQYEQEVLTAELGSRFEVVNMGFKAYPCCGYTHGPIEGTLSLIQANGIKPENIHAINISVGSNAADLFVPLERKRRPTTVPDAQFSIPYTVAAAALKGSVTIADFTPDAIRDPRVLDIAQRVSPIILKELTRREIEPSIVEIVTRDGNLYTKRIEYRKGTPNNPMSPEEMAYKFRDCLSFGRRHIGAQDADDLIDILMNLENLEDVGSVIRALG